jgi:LysM repeat protein
VDLHWHIITSAFDSTTNHFKARRSEGTCQINLPVSKFVAMRPFIFWTIISVALRTASAQTPAPDATKSAEAPQLETLTKKIEEQNAKIDALSQEILKLEQQLSHVRPGVMIGEGAPSPAAAGTPATTPSVSGNMHTVARGETLTSIAKLYKVTVDDLQNANHIEDGRKLQAGQTIIVPTPSPAGSSSSSPN